MMIKKPMQTSESNHTHTQRRGVLPVVAERGDVQVPFYQRKEVIGLLKMEMKRRGVLANRWEDVGAYAR